MDDLFTVTSPEGARKEDHNPFSLKRRIADIAARATACLKRPKPSATVRKTALTALFLVPGSVFLDEGAPRVSSSCRGESPHTGCYHRTANTSQHSQPTVHHGEYRLASCGRRRNHGWARPTNPKSWDGGDCAPSVIPGAKMSGRRHEMNDLFERQITSFSAGRIRVPIRRKRRGSYLAGGITVQFSYWIFKGLLK